MKYYSYFIILLAVIAFAYLAYEEWTNKPGMVVFFALLTILIIYREIRSAKL